MEAEAPNNSQSRFFCHSCSTEIDHISSDFKCPRCLLGFIEELPPAETPASNDMDVGSNDFNADNQVLRFANEIFSNPLLTPILMSASGARPGDAYGEGSSEEGAARLGGRRPGPRRDINITNFDTILQDILISVGGGEAPSLFFTGNPGDYAWGREGLDTIVTQLLNQMDNTGPPPLEKEKIEEIPKVQVEQEQVDTKLQCSVCWEDFVLDEQVRKLPCSHLYHENCIVPWLQCHGTCPICRQSLVSPDSQPHPGSEQQRNSLSAAAQAVANTIRNVTSVMRPSNSSNASTSAATSQQDSNTSASDRVFNPSAFLLSNPLPSESNTTSSSTASSSGGGRLDDRRQRDDDGNIDYDFD